MRIKSLQQRTILFILLPIFLLLAVMSTVGYLSMKRVLLGQWGDATSVKLQRTAHQIDMRLRQPKDLLSILHLPEETEVDRGLLQYIFKRIEALDAVVAVHVTWPDGETGIVQMVPKGSIGMMAWMQRLRLDDFTLSPPVFNRQVSGRTVSMVSVFRQGEQQIPGRIEVVIAFEKLIDLVTEATWWKDNDAYLVDDSGHILAAAGADVTRGLPSFGDGDLLRKRTLEAMRKTNNGMVFGEGISPGRVSGFYRLSEAPWTMVIIAPGEAVLAPIIRFSNFYIFTIGLSIFGILLVVRTVIKGITTSIEELSVAADNLAQGRFGSELPVTSEDEVGELTCNFNTMTRQLRQGLALQEAIGVAREVQQNLLPQEVYVAEHVQASGVCLYCDETGGDYFDIIQDQGQGGGVAVVVGDVVGHGVGAALLMATVRALVRAQVFQGDRLDVAINRVNRILCSDTLRSGNFVTLFCLAIDQEGNKVDWIRAGHDSAIVYCPERDAFSELRGSGIALGVEPDWVYQCEQRSFSGERQVVLIASDGAWEVENGAGENFGKDRLRAVLATNSDSSPEEILQAMVQEIKDFSGSRRRQDDITLLVVKIE